MQSRDLILAHHELKGYLIGNEYWIFAPYHYRPSYWLILKREGFSGDNPSVPFLLFHIALVLRIRMDLR